MKFVAFNGSPSGKASATGRMQNRRTDGDAITAVKKTLAQ